MQYRMQRLTDADAALLWQASGAAVPTEAGAEEEIYVFRAVDPGGRRIGGCVLDIDMMKNAEFNALWVDEAFCRRGVGTALIRAAEQKAMECGCRTIQNAFTFDWQNARSLFETRGYRLTGIFRNWPKGHEGYVLTKRLDAALTEAAVPSAFAVVPGSEADGEAIHAALEASYASVAPRAHPYRDLDRKFVDANGSMIAGCIAGVSGWDTLHIDAIWADESYRSCGLGSALLAEIEREAKETGAYLAKADAPKQAEAFFIRNGYRVVVAYEDEPKWVVLQKEFKNHR